MKDYEKIESISVAIMTAISDLAFFKVLQKERDLAESALTIVKNYYKKEVDEAHQKIRQSHICVSK